MIFDLTANSNGRKLPTIDPNYPLDQSVTFIKGNTASATFEARITEDGRPAKYSYQWYLDGASVSGAMSSSFQFNGISAAGNHTIYCVITSAAGSVQTRTATLKANMLYTPVLNSSYPEDKTVTFVKGSTGSAAFEVKIATAGNPASYTYQWYLDGTAVSGATSSSFQFNGISASGKHTIYCVITNAAGSVQTRTATLTADMYYTPVLNASYPADASVAVNVGVTCKVEISTAGNPASYTYQWYVNGSAVSGATSSSYTVKPTAIGSTTVYCVVKNSAGSVQSRTATITASIIPQFTYTGSYKLLDDSGNTITTSSNVTNWRIKFLTSGTLKFTNLFSAANGIDIFCVGGGGGGDASGGCGGKTTTAKAKTVTAGTSYTVTVGAGGAAGKSGGKSSFGSLASAAGGGGPGGAGGSGGGGSGLYITSSNKANGGNGGSNGANGVNGYGTSGFKNGTGQRTTTREFGSSSGTLYAGGGGGAGDYDCTSGKGGAGGGGAGGSIHDNGPKAGGAGTKNLGGGGGGGSTGGKGGSGIVIIRNKR